MARYKRMGLLAAASAALILTSVLVLWTLPANPGDATDEAMTYFFVGTYIIGLALTGPVIYSMRGRPKDSRGDNRTEETFPAAEHEEYESSDGDDYISDIEREFRALEMEIDREELE